MTTSNMFYTFGVLFFTIALIWGVSWLVVRLELVPGLKRKSKQKNTSNMYITESLPLDTKRRMVKVEDGEFEHLILLGPTSETHVHSKKINIKPQSVSEQNEETQMTIEGDTKNKALH